MRQCALTTFWIVCGNVRSQLRHKTILQTCDNWDTDCNSDNREPDNLCYLTIKSDSVDSICNSWDVFNIDDKTCQYLNTKMETLVASPKSPILTSMLSLRNTFPSFKSLKKIMNEDDSYGHKLQSTKIYLWIILLSCRYLQPNRI